ICKPSLNVKRFLRFFAPAALFGPGDVIVAAPVVVVPPPITIPPGPCPLTKERLDGYVANAKEYSANTAREKTALKLLRICGEKMCVSRMLATCERSVTKLPNSGSAKGDRLSPSSMV